VTIRVEGARPDADGYAIILASTDSASTLVEPSGGIIRFPDLAPGSHSVRLDGMASNCSVEGANPRLVDLNGGQLLTLLFLVRCPAPGTLLITTSSRGADLDPDGYTVNLEGPSVREQHIGVNDSLLIEIPDGHWSVRLGQVRENCVVESGVAPETAVASFDPLRVRLEGDLSVRVQFTAACLPKFSRIAFADFPSDVYVVPGIDGRAVNVTNHGLVDDWATDGAPALSRDRSRIAFVSNRGQPHDFFAEFTSDLFTVDADGSGVTQLTNTPGDEWIGQQAWSPDGSRIAFTYTDSLGTDVYVMETGGRAVVRLTEDGSIGCAPAWSPDGAWIAFCIAGGIYRMAPIVGSSRIEIVGQGAFPSWSPDGSKIAFMDPRANLAVIGIDGSGFVTLNPNDSDHTFFPSWSPDGSWIAFERIRHDESGNHWDVVMVPFLGNRFGEVVRITSGREPSWR
jgi:hypothetical protein